MNKGITTNLKGKLGSKAYLFNIVFLNINTDQEVTLGTLIVNSQSGKASARLIPDKNFYLGEDFNMDELASDCLNYIRELEENCIIF